MIYIPHQPRRPVPAVPSFGYYAMQNIMPMLGKMYAMNLQKAYDKELMQEQAKAAKAQLTEKRYYALIDKGWKTFEQMGFEEGEERKPDVFVGERGLYAPQIETYPIKDESGKVTGTWVQRGSVSKIIPKKGHSGELMWDEKTQSYLQQDPEGTWKKVSGAPSPTNLETFLMNRSKAYKNKWKKDPPPETLADWQLDYMKAGRSQIILGQEDFDKRLAQKQQEVRTITAEREQVKAELKERKYLGSLQHRGDIVKAAKNRLGEEWKYAEENERNEAMRETALESLQGKYPGASYTKKHGSRGFHIPELDKWIPWDLGPVKQGGLPKETEPEKGALSNIRPEDLPAFEGTRALLDYLVSTHGVTQEQARDWVIRNREALGL